MENNIMDLNKFEPARALKSLRHEVDSLFDRFVERPLGVITGQVIPPLDLSETDAEIIVRMDLPGMDEKEIDISIQNESLIIRGEKKEQREESGKTYHLVERATGSFVRSIPLPVQVRVDMVRATYQKGVLEVCLPKKELAQARKIEIKVQE
jgi:HSP20 family protein